MFVTAEQVNEVSPLSATITVEDVRAAQFVIEVFVGRTENEITFPRDQIKMGRAVIAQAIYMKDKPDISFNQISVSTISRGDGLTTFRSGDFASPFIAPLALMSLGGLSWMRSRSITFGRLHQREPVYDWRKD